MALIPAFSASALGISSRAFANFSMAAEKAKEILEEMDVEHPAAKMMVEVSKTQLPQLLRQWPAFQP